MVLLFLLKSLKFCLKYFFKTKKRNFPNADISKLANGILVELSNPKQAKEAKETFGKVFKNKSTISVQTALATVK